nr:MAG TPA: hypothetical protein [Caudoviricetes sp.]
MSFLFPCSHLSCKFLLNVLGFLLILFPPLLLTSSLRYYESSCLLA